MSKDSSKSAERPEIPCLYTPVKRMRHILGEEIAILEKVLNSEACQTPDLSPFCDFTCEAIKDIQRAEKILKIVMQHLEDDGRFWGEAWPMETENRAEETREKLEAEIIKLS